MKDNIQVQKLDDEDMLKVIGGTGQGVDQGGVRLISRHCQTCHPNNPEMLSTFEVSGDVAKCINCGSILLKSDTV